MAAAMNDGDRPGSIPRRWSGVIALLALWAIASYFLVAAIPKLIDPAAFQQDILAYRLNGWADSAAAALLLPVLEALAAVALLLPRWRRAGLAIIAGLLLVFIAALLQAGLRGIDIHCGCITRGAGAGPWLGATENLATLAVVIWLWRWGHLRRPQHD